MSEAVVESTHKNLAMAFAAAAAEFPEIPKDKENPHFKSRYSSFDAIKTACWPPLLKHGIAPYHRITQADGRLIVTFVLEHVATGETDTQSSLNVPEGQTPQAIGLQITYLRRYTAAPRLGVCSDEDDDGNAATQNAAARGGEKQRTTDRKPAEPPPAKKPTTAEHIASQKTAADLGSLLMAWVGKRPVSKNSREWARIVSEAADHISGAGWDEEQVRPVLAVLNGIRKEILDLDSKEAFGGERAKPAEPAPKATEAPSLERIAGWLDQLETAADLQNALASIDSSPKLADLRSNPARVIEVLRHAFKLTQDRVAVKDWTEEQGQTLADELTAMETKYDLSQQAAAQFPGSDA